MEDALEKLGTVLAVANQVNRDSLSLLEEQQKRQKGIMLFSMAVIAMAFIVVAWTVYWSFNSIDNLSSKVEENRIRVEQNTEALRHGRNTENGKAISE